jgi:hypothetical protein
MFGKKSILFDRQLPIGFLVEHHLATQEVDF